MDDDGTRGDERQLLDVGPGVFVATAGLWSTTSTVIVADGDALVVDPAMSVIEVEALAATIAARGWRVRAGFSTHPHWDHLLWSPSLGPVARFATATGVRVAAARREHARLECAQCAPGHDLDYLTGAVALDPGAERLPGPWALPVIEHRAHVAGHAGLVAGDVLIAGDMLSDVEVPLLGEEPDAVADYRAGLAALEAATRAHDIRVVVPGHGTPAIGRAAIEARFAADRAYLEALIDRAGDEPGPDDDAVDPRIRGYVADWHTEQLAGLRAR